MPYFLNLVYVVLLCALSPWLLWAAVRKGKYRSGYAAKFLGAVPLREGNELCVWLHAVSAGEVSLLEPLVSRLESHFPHAKLVITTTTNTGFAMATKRYPQCTVCYCPLDFSWAVRRALDRIRPDLLVLAELELWPNLIRAARRSGSRIAVVNGRLSQRSAAGYRRIGWFVRPLLRDLDLIAVQSDQYAERFLELGAKAEAVQVTGSMKFDGAETDRENCRTRRLARLAGLDDADIVFLAGSTQSPEEALAIEAYCRLQPEFPRLRLILAPRHPERADEVAALLHRAGLPWERRSELEATGQAKTRVLLIDTIGELSAWWGTAQLSYVGGSMGSRGGQNMIEPAAYAAAVSFGPRTHNFREVVQLLLAGQAAVVVRDGNELQAFLRACLQDEQYRLDLGRRAQQLVRQQLGAADVTLDLLSDLLNGGEKRIKAA